MTRKIEIHGGSFGRLLGAAVHANGWWLRHAADVALHGDKLTAHPLATFMPDHEELDIDRLLRLLPAALQMPAPEALPVGFVAMRVEETPEGGIDVGYPFVLQEADSRTGLAFGTDGPAPAVRDEIIAAFVRELTRTEMAQRLAETKPRSGG